MGSKLSRHAFTRFWDLHAWSGVVAGLVLYLMFVTGAVTLFHSQLQTWQEPLCQRTASGRESFERTLERVLTAKGATPDEFWFYPPTAARGAARIAFEEGGKWQTFWFDAQEGRLVPERESVADFIYALHYLWHDITGEWLYYLSGFFAVALLLALVTGVLIHFKDLIRQFHQFRPAKSRRVFWSDMHKVLGVMGLPFQLMYAYTGAYIVLAPLLLAAFTGPVFKGDEQKAAAMTWGSFDKRVPSPGAPIESLPLDELARRAVAARPGFAPEYFHVVQHGRERGVVQVSGPDSGSPHARIDVRLRAVDGTLLADPTQEGAGASTRRWIYGLHFAHFGGVPLRFLFFLLALAGAATILTGNWVWLSRRNTSRGNEVLARLTLGVGAGTWVALGALFLSSRLLPLDWRVRGSVEELTFLGALVACVVWALVARNRYHLWWRQLGLAACLLLPVPALAVRWSSAGLFGAGPALGAVLAVDIGMLAVAGALGGSAFLLRRALLRTTATALPPAMTDSTASSPVRLVHSRGHDA